MRPWQAALAEPGLAAYLAELDGQPVGVVAVAGDFLRNLYVVPEHWGRGVGSALHDHALTRLRACGRRTPGSGCSSKTTQPGASTRSAAG